MSVGKRGPVAKVLDTLDYWNSEHFQAVPITIWVTLVGYVMSPQAYLVTKVGRHMLNCEAWTEEQTVYKG